MVDSQATLLSQNEYKFCPYCGRPLSLTKLPTEDRSRLICEQEHILYLNPKVLVHVLAERDGRILLVRRAIEPRSGYWTLPGGFMEIDETVEECALREVREETNVEAQLEGLLAVYSKAAPPGPGLVFLIYSAVVIKGEPETTREVSEVGWFTPADIPWDELAYDTTQMALHAWAELKRS